MNEAEHTIKQLREGDELTISSVYKSNREKFISYARRFDINREDIIDIYQDAIIALTENAKKGLLDGLKSEISTYLFSIGKYMIYNHLKKNKNLPLFEKNIPDDITWNDYTEEMQDDDVRKMKASFSKLGEQCQKVLRLFYYEEKKLDDIVTALAYSNKDVLKSQKSRCIKQLKELIQNDK